MFITLISHQNKCSLQRKASSFTTLQSFHLKGTKILQKSGIQKNEVIELIYRGFI